MNSNLPFVPVLRQSIPNRGLFSAICCALTSANVFIGENPLFSANANGTDSSASANARIAYCSIVGIYRTNKFNIKKLKFFFKPYWLL